MTLLPDVTMSDQGDILYVTLRETSIVNTREYGDDRLLDFDCDGQIVGAEFIGVASYVDLRGLPESHRLQDAIIASDVASLDLLIESAEVAD